LPARITLMRFSSAFLFLTAVVFAACASKNPPPVSGGLMVPPTVQSPDQGPQLAGNEIAQQLFDALNKQRTANGLPPLAMSPDLTRSAQEHSDKMVSETFLSTRGPDEADAVTRITSQGVKTLKLGEDVGRLKTRPDRVADDTMSIWMSAAANRKNILSSTFTKAGVAVAHAPDGDYYVSADFAQ
jgi:uncharacterized protein YkwD